MKFLVLGCNGMAGHMISLYLREQGHDVFGFAHTKSPYVDSAVGDARDVSLVKEIVGFNRFDAVVNCIGLLNKACEERKADAVYLNSCLPHLLAELTEGSNTQIVHLSTDCVFSGKRGQYTETDLPDGETFYDRTKALGELNDGKNITLRSSIVGPDINRNGIGLLNWFMQQSGSVNGYTKTIWTGQTTLQLAKTIEAVAAEKAHGLYNIVPDQSVSKYELLKLFNHYLRGDAVNIVAVDGIDADKSLKRTNYDFDYRIPNYEYMVAELAEWMHAHKELYAHYIQ